jgi:hypothetical protein
MGLALFLLFTSLDKIHAGQNAMLSMVKLEPNENLCITKPPVQKAVVLTTTGKVTKMPFYIHIELDMNSSLW